MNNPLADEVFTMAFYLLGSDELALAASEAVFAGLVGGKPVSRLKALRLAARQIERRRGLQMAPRHAGDGWTGRLLALPLEQRLALVLVDVLGLSLAEAAQVTGSEPRRALALARQRLLAFGVGPGALQPSQNGAPVSTSP